MSDGRFDLTRRRVLGSAVTIGAASAAAGAGTMAYFSDTEESTGNTVSAGTLDLTADGGDSEVTTVDISGVTPGESGSGSSSLANAGSIDGSVDLVFGEATNAEGDDPDSEGDTSPPGDLGGALEVEVAVGSTTVRGDFDADDPPTFDDVFDGSEADADVPLAADSSKDLTIAWRLPGDVGNDVQGDSVSGDITVELNQADEQ